MSRTASTEEGGQAARAKSVLIGVAVVAVLVVAVRALPVGDWLVRFQEYVRGLGAAGYALYAIGYALCVVLFVPASVLTLGAGALYGLGVGVLVVLAGASTGAMAAFLLARTLLRGRVEKMTRGSAKFGALDRAIAKEGAKIVFLVRLAPIFPFTYINYAFGLTGVRPGAYAWATVFGMIPGTFAYVYLGMAAAGAATAGAADTTRTVVQILGAVAAVGVTGFVARLAGRAIREAGVDDEGTRR